MDDTKEAILICAVDAFASRGYNAVGVQEICASAGITKPTLYYHYGSKSGLLEAVAQTRYAPFVADVGAALAYRGDVAASLNAALGVFLAYAEKEPAFSRLRLALAFSPPESEEHRTFRPHTERLYALARNFFSAASGDHGNMAGRETAYSASFIGTADAYAALILAGSADVGRDLQSRVVHHFMHGIFS